MHEQKFPKCFPYRQMLYDWIGLHGLVYGISLAICMERHGLLHGLALPICTGLHAISAWVCIGHLHGLAWPFAWACFGHPHGLAWAFCMDFNWPSAWPRIELSVGLHRSTGRFFGAHWAALGHSRVGFFRSSGAGRLLMVMLYTTTLQHPNVQENLVALVAAGDGGGGEWSPRPAPPAHAAPCAFRDGAPFAVSGEAGGVAGGGVAGRPWAP